MGAVLSTQIQNAVILRDYAVMPLFLSMPRIIVRRRKMTSVEFEASVGRPSIPAALMERFVSSWGMGRVTVSAESQMLPSLLKVKVAKLKREFFCQEGLKCKRGECVKRKNKGK